MINFVNARDLHGDILPDIGIFDFVPDAYLPLICKFVEELEPLVEQLENPEEFYFLDVKEKYGELRFYPSFYNDEINELIERYTDLSRDVVVNENFPLRTEGY